MSQRGTTESYIMGWTYKATCGLIESINNALGPITDNIGNSVAENTPSPTSAVTAATSRITSDVSSLASDFANVASSTASDFVNVASSTASNITPNELRMQGVRGTAAICLGFFFCFYGKKIFRPFIGLMGFFAFGLLGLLSGSWYSFHYQFKNEPFWVMVFTLLMGSFGAMLCIKVWKMAIASISMVSGYIGTQYLMTVLQPVLNRNIDFEATNFLSCFNCDNVFVSITPYTNYISVAGVIVAYVLSRYFEDSIILFGTSIIGAVSVVYGIDTFAEYGFKETLVKCIQGDTEWAKKCIDSLSGGEERLFVPDLDRPQLMYMNIGCLGLIVLGILVQYLTASPKKKVVVSSA